jgi:DNA-binding transcriptional LysR family regulator
VVLFVRDIDAAAALVRVSKTFTHSELEVEMLFEDPPRIVVGALNPLARRRKLALPNLVDEAWTLTSDEVIREFINDAFRSAGLSEPRVVVSASSMLLHQRLLATGRYTQCYRNPFCDATPSNGH